MERNMLCLHDPNIPCTTACPKYGILRKNVHVQKTQFDIRTVVHSPVYKHEYGVIRTVVRSPVYKHEYGVVVPMRDQAPILHCPDRGCTCQTRALVNHIVSSHEKRVITIETLMPVTHFLKYVNLDMVYIHVKNENLLFIVYLRCTNMNEVIIQMYQVPNGTGSEERYSFIIPRIHSSVAINPYKHKCGYQSGVSFATVHRPLLKSSVDGKSMYTLILMINHASG